MKTGYCCNVHGGTTLEEVKQNLERYALSVKQEVSPNKTMPVGLWLSESAIADLGDTTQSNIDATNSFGDWLIERGLDPFTFNGFPLGDFHQDVVKHDVYLPTWADASRLEYTKRLAMVQTMLLARTETEPGFQTISTLPLGWPPVVKEALFEQGDEFLRQCASQLHSLAKYLSDLKSDRGSHVMVCIEPEPGCVFDSCYGIVRFFREYLLDCDSALADKTLAHIGICHDVCHSAVMFEDQETAVKAYIGAGIQIGKVQISSAIKAHFIEGDSENDRKLEQLAQFSEPKYLHQTSIRCPGTGERFYEDLSVAMLQEKAPSGQWRVHFHVPIFVDQLGLIETTQGEINAFMKAIRQHEVAIEHFEIETYAWNVLPEMYRELSGDLAHGIAEELKWFAARSN